MFDFLKNLFKKPAPVKSGEPISIDITGTNIIINKNKLALPSDIDKITAVLGAPRAVQYETNIDDKNFLDKLHGSNSVTNRVNYFWDSIGIKCYTLDSRTVSTFAIELNQGALTFPNTTEGLFKGVVTINGRPWLPQIKAGTDLEVMQQLRLGKYSLACEYTDFEQQPSQRTERDYTSIEVGLAK